MRFTYCPDCGQKLILKDIGDEGATPYCEACKTAWFDMFSTCVITLVTNDKDEVLLLNQDYISTQYRNLVSGYMKPGERAEDAAKREVLEEVGIELKELKLVSTHWFAKKGLLMIGFIGKAANTNLTLSKEVDGAAWIKATEALPLVHPKSSGSVSHILVEEYINRLKKQGF